MPQLPDVRLIAIASVEELQRIVDEFFDKAPLETAYGAIAGDDEANVAKGDYDELPIEEQRRIQAVACRYFWLSAVRKRLAKP
jgi:hypothetical protein